MSAITNDSDALARVLADTGEARDAAGLIRVLASRQLLSPQTVDKLADLSREKARVDVHECLRLAEAALAVGRAVGGEEPVARGLRAKANALWFGNQNREAVELYEQAIELYERRGNDVEIGRTLSSAIQPLIRLGQYERATNWAARARAIFSAAGDTLRLARLELNAANIYHRQDRLAEAFDAYDQAYRQLLPTRDVEAIGAALHNMAVCLIGLNDFPRALAAHQAARTYCEEHGMPALVIQADYNVAYLYYLRGEYVRGLEGLRAAYELAGRSGDAYHRALCCMDQSDIYLELNLSEEASEVANEAFTQFQNLGMMYEAAKCLANHAIALARRSRYDEALDAFGKAREMFVRENNWVWPSVIDLSQGHLKLQMGNVADARAHGLRALEFFVSSGLAVQQLLCNLLLAEICLRENDTVSARGYCEAALKTNAPGGGRLVYRVQLLMAEIEEAAGNDGRAMEFYEAARASVEFARILLRSDELKIGFMKNKVDVYEGLVRMSLRQSGNSDARKIFEYIEGAKSRSLRDLMGNAGARLEDAETGEAAARMHELREELNWYYHRIEAVQFDPEASPRQLQVLEAEAGDREKQLLRLSREAAEAKGSRASVNSAPALPVEAVQAALHPDAVVVEYFRAGEVLIAAVITGKSMEVVELGSMSEVEPMVRMLRFQLSKFRLGAAYTAVFQESMLRAITSQLGQLYDVLVRPLRRHLRGNRLVIAPHECLHQLPWHALWDGSQHLMDEFTVSYAPSASIYALCLKQPVAAEGRPLVLGVSDQRAPLIDEEAAMVAAALGDAKLLLGADASRRALAELGPSSRLIHLATHGKYDPNNPMFSAIRLGDGLLTLFDLYQFRLPAELITLSGCSTGLNVVERGDELLGLVRGLFHAGARSVLLSLWDVQDRTTAELMKSFYSRLRAGEPAASALRGAMADIRERWPHPYFWAPLVLVGGANG
jgi:CHAT domain-containing protein